MKHSLRFRDEPYPHFTPTRVKKNPGTPLTSGVPPSPDRTSRSSRKGVSQSQPSSRSSSPSSRLNSGIGSSGVGPLSLSSARSRLPSGIPRSLAGSRETSPTRLGRGNSDRRGTTPQRAPTAALRMLQQSRDAERDTSIGMLNTALSPDESLGLESLRIRDDDSEASSVCSERSVDSYRRHDSYSWSGSQGRLGGLSGMSEVMSPPPPPAEIIALCASTHWTERKDGLIHLTNYLNSGRLLPPSDLRNLTELLGRMFVDAHTKVFSLFLDAVAELIVAHSQQLEDWLYLLLTRLLMKLGNDLLGSIQTKVYKMLELVHEYFPSTLQLTCICRFLADGAHAPSSKTRAAALNFLAQLAAEYCPPVSLASLASPATSPVAVRALSRVCSTATDPRPSDSRTNARRALAALYDCNAPVMTQILGELPPETQATVAGIVQTHIKRTSSGGENSPSPVSGMHPAISGGAEDVYRSLRRTTAEIRSYTAAAGKYETTGNSASKDSGISQLSEHNGFLQNGHYGGEIVISSTTPHLMNSPRAASADSSEEGAGSNTKDSSPTVIDGAQTNVCRENSDDRDSGGRGDRSRQYEKDEEGYLIMRDGRREQEVMEKFVSLRSPADAPAVWEKCLNALIEVIRYGDCRTPQAHFKGIIRVCLAALNSDLGLSTRSPGSMVPDAFPSPVHKNSDGDDPNQQEKRDPVIERCAALAVKALILLCRRPETRQLWLSFFDLILVKLIDNYGGPNRELTRAVDAGVASIARAVPAAQTIALSCPVLRTRDAPHSVCALKLVAEVARERPAEITDEHLDKMMLAISTHADHPSSPVRKAAVFCIVALTLAVGEERMEPFTKMLSPSKNRLLQVYLRKNRGEQQQDGLSKS